MAAVLGRLGSSHALVVHANDGLDEISLGDATQIWELKGGEVSSYAVTPEELGLERAGIDRLKVDGVEESVQTLREVLDGRHSRHATSCSLTPLEFLSQQTGQRPLRKASLWPPSRSTAAGR